MNVWIISNLLSLIFDKTYYLQFRAKTSYPIDINSFHNKYIVNASITPFSVILLILHCHGQNMLTNWWTN